jgi:hypothetical protein
MQLFTLFIAQPLTQYVSAINAHLQVFRYAKSATLHLVLRQILHSGTAEDGHLWPKHTVLKAKQ